MPQTPHVERHFSASETIRDIVIGMSDGLTVPFALAAGLSGAAQSSGVVITAGLAEIAAGSIAMGLGGYLAARTDAEHYEAERAREARETIEMPEEETEEVARIFRSYGLPEATVASVAQAIRSNRRRWVDFMMKFELGLEKPAPRLGPALTLAVPARDRAVRPRGSCRPRRGSEHSRTKLFPIGREFGLMPIELFESGTASTAVRGACGSTSGLAPDSASSVQGSDKPSSAHQPTSSRRWPRLEGDRGPPPARKGHAAGGSSLTGPARGRGPAAEQAHASERQDDLAVLVAHLEHRANDAAVGLAARRNALGHRHPCGEGVSGTDRPEPA